MTGCCASRAHFAAPEHVRPDADREPALLARDDFGSPRIAGVFFAAFGAGAVVGSLSAIRLVTRIEPIRLGAGALLLLTLPIPLLGLTLPVAAVCCALRVRGLRPDRECPAAGGDRHAVAGGAAAEGHVRAADLRAARRPARAAGRRAAARHVRRARVLLAIGVGQILVALPFVWFAFRRRETLPKWR